MKIYSYIKAKCTLAASLLMLFCLHLEIFAGWEVRGTIPGVDRSEGYEVRLGGCRFINPLLECKMVEDTLRNQELELFENKVKELSEKRKKDKFIHSVSVYFLDLNNSPFFNIHARGLC